MVQGSITSRCVPLPEQGKAERAAEIEPTVVTEPFSDHLIGFIESVCLQRDVNIALKRRENSFIKTKILTISPYLVR